MKLSFFKRSDDSDKKMKVAAAVAALLVLVYGSYRYYSLQGAFEAAKREFASTTTALEAQVSQLESSLATSSGEKAQLSRELQIEQERNNNFDTEIKGLVGSVSTLQKLSMTDRELLQKYSKVYFLSENYVPSSLLDISRSGFAYDPSKILQIHSGVWPYLQKLLQTAAQDGVNLQILSAYRSFGTQSTLKATYRFVYGSGANKFSADQGYSEHQLGTAVDFTTPQGGPNLDKFKGSGAYAWLTARAYEYGFILSYPLGNAYYQFEPWHWRFVGLKLATYLHDNNEHFYDLDQRMIDQYLINIFD